jgi:hypothetical protein
LIAELDLNGPMGTDASPFAREDQNNPGLQNSAWIYTASEEPGWRGFLLER